MSPIEIAILGLYFLTLVILAVLGSHRYIMVYLYYRHRDRQRACPLPLPGAPAPGHRPAPHLQRDVRGGAPARLGLAHPLPEGPARDPGPRRLHGRDPGHRPAGGRALPRAGLRHPLPPPHRPHRLQGGRARRRASPWPRASSSSSSTPTSWLPRTSSRRRVGPVHRPEGRDGADALGPHQPRLLAPDPGAVGHARRALHPRARRAQPLRPLLQLQRHRAASGAAPPSRTPAAGSTTPSPKTSTSPTARR